jgi:putative PIN family toxin of toxin-antitoxin system
LRLLLDTNVLVAALVARGTCTDLLEHCVRQHHVIVSSQPLLDKLRDVLERKFRLPAVDVRSALQLFTETFMLVVPGVIDHPTCRDRDDDLVLATALAGQCAAIVTGGRDVLILDPFQAIRILAPSAFWEWESRT